MRTGAYLLVLVALVAFALLLFFGVKPSGLNRSSYSLSEDKPLSFNPDIVIPYDYPTIQEGIDHAAEGDCILVRAGTYVENIVVDKPNLIIKGENRFTTIVDGGKKTDAIAVSAPNITIEGFTVTNGWNENEYLWDVSGVKILSSNVTVKGNIIKSNRLGVTVVTSAYNLTIVDNTFIGDGILLGNYEYTYTLSKKDFLHIVMNNTVNGKPLYYYKNQCDFLVPNDAGQIILANCTNATIKDVHLTRTDFPIILGYCFNCIIENSTVTETDGEIILFHSENNIIQWNNVSHGLHGICLDFESRNNIIRYNKASDNWVGISVMTYSTGNRVYGNTVQGNSAGIMIFNHSCNNIVSENKVFNNNIGIQLQLSSTSNLIEKNSVSKSRIGLQIKGFSDRNTIKYNVFVRNFPVDALFSDSSANSWSRNYWSRPRILPKVIFGYRILKTIPVPWVNVDYHPLLRQGAA